MTAMISQITPNDASRSAHKGDATIPTVSWAEGSQTGLDAAALATDAVVASIL